MNELFRDLFIFEMANNHQGSVEHGLRIIEAMGAVARRHNIRAGVKLQYRDLDTFIHLEFKNRQDVKHVPRFLSTRLSKDQYLTLVEAVRDQGMISIVTPFDEASVALCQAQDIQILKVASCSANDWPLLEVIAAAGKPTIISTGGLAIYDIDKVVNFFTHRKVDFALMHCVSVYPTPDNLTQMDFMQRLIRRYRSIPVGYSGHEAPDNLDVVKAAIAKGAALLERHVGVPTETISLNKYSLNPEQADEWVASALKMKTICAMNGNEKQISQGEINELLSLKRGVYALRAIAKGAQIQRQDVYFAMPCVDGQVSSGEFGQYRRTWIASRDYQPNEAIHERSKPDAISAVRSIIHDAKGMLYEANIEFGSNFEIELSHHYGIEKFRETGAILIGLINREYCKKLVVVFSGQQHPSHMHKQKEETFQLLWGDLTVDLNGSVHHMIPGDMLLIERGAWHSFSSHGGAIFEEVSTTHIRHDSFYEDERIRGQDPMLRKTILDEW